MMTIQQFAYRTGLSSHTLRFYDKKGLLKPAIRMENGYRGYSEEQIADALMIHTLRQANVAIEDIEMFLKADKEQKRLLIQKWRNEIEAKMLSIKVAKQYLDRMEADDTRIHLTKWEEPVQVIWFPYKGAKTSRASLYDIFEQERKHAVCNGFKVGPYVFVKTLESKTNYWSGKIGIKVESVPSSHSENTQRFSVEEQQPTVFAVLECSTEDQFVCFSYVHFVKRFGFNPIGDNMECYNLADRGKFQLMVPILRL